LAKDTRSFLYELFNCLLVTNHHLPSATTLPPVAHFFSKPPSAQAHHTPLVYHK
jgi:hypothetical protein